MNHIVAINWYHYAHLHQGILKIIYINGGRVYVIDNTNYFDNYTQYKETNKEYDFIRFLK